MAYSTSFAGFPVLAPYYKTPLPHTGHPPGSSHRPPPFQETAAAAAAAAQRCFIGMVSPRAPSSARFGRPHGSSPPVVSFTPPQGASRPTPPAHLSRASPVSLQAALQRHLPTPPAPSQYCDYPPHASPAPRLLEVAAFSSPPPETLHGTVSYEEPLADASPAAPLPDPPSAHPSIAISPNSTGPVTGPEQDVSRIFSPPPTPPPTCRLTPTSSSRDSGPGGSLPAVTPDSTPRSVLCSTPQSPAARVVRFRLPIEGRRAHSRGSPESSTGTGGGGGSSVTSFPQGEERVGLLHIDAERIGTPAEPLEGGSIWL